MFSLRVGDRDGFGRYGLVDETDDGLLCHECGGCFRHLGLHAFRAHGLTADEFRVAHGLGSRGLIASETARVVAENARRTLPGKERFVQARDPLAASRAQRRGSGAISPAGLEAIRKSAAGRRGKARKGTVVTCRGCHAQFCPLVAAAKRRFCSRPCAARYNRIRVSNP